MTSPDTGAIDALDANVKLTAAISTHFDPLKLLGATSLLDDGRAEAIDGLAGVCEEVDVSGSDYRHWAMRPEVRRQVLQTMAAQPDFAKHLDAVQVPPGDSFARYLTEGLRGADLGALLEPAGASPAPPSSVDLDGLLKAVRFLEDLPELPTVNNDLERTVRRQIAVVEADNALRSVTPPRLVGRAREYAALLEYCSTPVATDQDWVPSFVLVGPGGVGKSALVSTFLSDRRRQATAAPIVYFDFDRATLIDVNPIELTFEFTRQLGLADITLEQPLSELRQRVRSLLGGRDAWNIDIGGGASSFALRDLATQLADWPRLLEHVTIVFDTFEEVAIRGVTPVRDALQWAAELRNTVQLKQLHLIICGREVVPDAPHLARDEVEAMFNYRPRWELEDLSADDATALLTELGVDHQLAVRFPPVFGGNPLALKLVHRFVKSSDPAEVEQLLADGERSRREGLYGEIGLRFVYERILNRIKKPRVRALAYPGVVLREVTPSLIHDVLVPTSPTEIDVATRDDARAAFDELAEHVWLVTRVGERAVAHRADLRRLLVPGLERSSEIDTDAIHRAAADYYAAQADFVGSDDARFEKLYHLGFLGDVADDMTESDADQFVNRLAGDLEYWPVHSRATVKSLAGHHDQLTEEEVASLALDQQIRTRGARLDRSYASSDVDSAGFEERMLAELDQDQTASAIPDSRWALLFDRGDFEFMGESSTVLSAFDRFFITEHSASWSLPSSPTHRHPWFIALATLMDDHGGRTLFSDGALAALDLGTEAARRYGAALAALAGDQAARTRIMARILDELPPVLDMTSVDDILICQAAASSGELDDRTTRFHAYSCDSFRLSHLAAIASSAGNQALSDQVTATMDRYLTRRPNTTELNGFRAKLARTPLRVGRARELRAAPTTLSFLYGATRTVVAQLDRTAVLEVVEQLEQRSACWPEDLTADTLSSTYRADLPPIELTAVVELADRCGLIVDLIDMASSKATTKLSMGLGAGIRRIEGLLFPFAKPRAALPHHQ